MTEVTAATAAAAEESDFKKCDCSGSVIHTFFELFSLIFLLILVCQYSIILKLKVLKMLSEGK